MLGKILTGVLGCIVAGIYYLLRKAGASKEMANLVGKALEQMVLEKAIYAVEAWAEKELQRTGRKITGSEKMKKAIAEVKRARKQLEKWGIKMDMGFDEEAMEKKIQAVFDQIKERLHSA